MSAEEAVERAGRDLTEILDRARELLKRGEYGAVLVECQEAGELGQDSAQVQVLRGRALHGSDCLEEAIAAYRMAIRYDPTLAEAWESLTQAESCLEASLTARASRGVGWEEHLRAHLDRAAELLEETSSGGAVLECDRALRLLPDSERAHYTGGAAQMELGRREQAVASFSLAVRRDPALTDAWLGLFRAESALDSAAAPAVQPEEAAKPEQLHGHLDRAYDCLDSRDFAGAFKACHAVLSLSPTSAEAHNLRGLVYDELGHLREAAGAYRLALHFDPVLEDARKNLLEVEREFTPPSALSSPAPAAGRGFGIRAGAYLLDVLVSSIVTWVVFVVATFVVGILLGLFN